MSESNIIIVMIAVLVLAVLVGVTEAEIDCGFNCAVCSVDSLTF